MSKQFYQSCRALVLGALFFMPLASHAQTTGAARQLHALLDAQWAWETQEYPEQATYRGDKRFDDRLTDLSPAAITKRKQHQQQLLAQLKRISAKQLTGQDAISHAVLLTSLELEMQINAQFGSLPFSANDTWMPVSQMSGIQMDFPALVKATSFDTAADYARYLKRLAALPRQIEQTIAIMKQGIASGWMPPAIAIRALPSQIDTHLTADVSQSLLFVPFDRMPADIRNDEQQRLRTAAMELIVKSVQPAFAGLKTFIEQAYLPAARRELGASTLPGGAAYYALMIRQGTTTGMQAREIHALGLREVARINQEMDAAMRLTGFKGNRVEFQKFINTDARFHFTRAEDLLAKYRDIAKRVDAELPRLFAELPRLPYGIRAMEAYEGDNAEYYTPGASDGSRAGYFEANANNLQRTPSYAMESLVLHETVPGHHLQIARQQELKDLPEFRKNGSFNAFSEGWALYAESLGNEIGFYKDPYNKFGQLSDEMWRACRLVMDTGIHAFGWSREQAIAYLETNAGAPHETAVAETDRYIVWPGQALGYKIGELRIKALRAKAKAALGEKFNVRRFHNAVLDNGAVPLDVLEQQITQWIATEKRRS
jgi:uncharacterized protein (DUF885 family)